YTPDVFWRWGAVVTVTLTHPVTSRSAANLRAVLDSGSPYTVVQPQVIPALALPEVVPRDLAHLRLFDGTQRDEPRHAARLNFQDERKRLPILPVKVAALDVKKANASLEMVIGRDTLAYFTMVHDGPGAAVTLIYQLTP